MNICYPAATATARSAVLFWRPAGFPQRYTGGLPPLSKAIAVWPPELSAIARLCRAPAQWSTPFQAALGWLSCLDARRPMHRPNPRPFFPGLLPKSRLRSCSSHRPSVVHLLSLSELVLVPASSSSSPSSSLHPLDAFGSYTRCAPPPIHTRPPRPLAITHESPASRSSFNNTKVSHSHLSRRHGHHPASRGTASASTRSAVSPSKHRRNTPIAIVKRCPRATPIFIAGATKPHPSSS